MNCPQCFQAVTGPVAFCPYCGVRLAEPGTRTALESSEDPTYGALAQANLMRLRGDWDEARAKTVDVMREFPNSGTAHSLMGDIYADQQMYAEAAQWYRMALDLEPNNKADSRKLDEVQKRLLADSEPPPETEAPAQFSAFRVAAIASMAFLVFAITLGFYVKTHTVPLLDMGPTWTKSSPPPQPTTPPTGPGMTPEVPAASQPVPEHHPSTEQEKKPDRTKRETQLFTALETAGQSLNTAGLILSDVQVDPRDSSAAITVHEKNTPTNDVKWANGILAACLPLARLALESDSLVESASVRVISNTGDAAESPDVVFIGELSRQSMGTGAPTAFTSTWWNPNAAASQAGHNTP